MGMTLWIQTLNDSGISGDSDDHSWLYRFADLLDERCEALGVARLSGFFDETDLEYNFADEVDDSEEDFEDSDCDPDEVGYSADDMQWFPVADGLKTCRALCDDLVGQRPDDLNDDDFEQLIAELNNCLHVLTEAAERDGRFHLLIVA